MPDSEINDALEQRRALEVLDSYRVEEDSPDAPAGEPGPLPEEQDGTITRPFNPDAINIKSKPMSLDNIIKRLRENEIDLKPGFQRKGNLWDQEKQSRLIESMLIRLPLPAFYFDGTDDNKWLVVDGLQRLSVIKNFVVDGRMRLCNLEFLHNIEGATFSELPRNFRRMIEETEITAYIINPGTPPDVKFNIFKRINTGGLVLEPQEIRHALNQGKPAKFVAELARLRSFLDATQRVISTERMLDREFTTRFMAFYLYEPAYTPDLDTFLSNAMGSLRTRSEEELSIIKKAFDASMTLARAIFGRWAFRKVYDIKERRKPINKALFEVWSVVLAQLTPRQRLLAQARGEEIFQAFIRLMNTDDAFVASITSATGDRSRVAYRYAKIRALLSSILGEEISRINRDAATDEATL